jgi:hypothetical protein
MSSDGNSGPPMTLGDKGEQGDGCPVWINDGRSGVWLT